MKRLRGCHSVFERYGDLDDATTTKLALAVVTFNAQAADVKINLNVTKIKSEDHDTRRLRAAIVRDRYFLQLLVAVGEVNAGRDIRFQDRAYRETDLGCEILSSDPVRESAMSFLAYLWEQQ